MLSNVKFVQEKRLISRFFDEISQDTGAAVWWWAWWRLQGGLAVALASGLVI